MWFVDEEMQTVTRLYSQKQAEATRETNRLWKALRKASGDLYLAFRGSHPDFSFAQSLLKLKSVVQLLAASPDVSSWHLIPRQELMRLAGLARIEGARSCLKHCSVCLQSCRRSHRRLSF